MTTFKRYNGTNWEYVGLPNNVGLSPQTLGYAEVTANQSGITSTVDLTGLSVTVTVPEGRRIRITSSLSFQSTVASDTFNFHIVQDGGIVQVDGLLLSPVATVMAGTIVSAVLTPSAGTHTYKMQAVRSNGTGSGTLIGSSGDPSWILVEDITGSTLPYSPSSTPVGALAQAFVTANQTGITTEVDIVGLSVNVAVPAGRQLKISVKGRYQTGTAGAGAAVAIYQDGSQINQFSQTTGEANISEEIYTETIVSPSAGAHTYKVRMANFNGGTALFGASVAIPAFILVEDITPTPTPGTGAPGSTLAYAEVTTVQGGITTETDVTGLSVTVSVPAGRRLRISSQILPASTVSTDKLRMRLKEDGNTIQFGQVDPIGPTSNTMTAEIVETPTAGMHTYKVTLARDVGTGTITNNADPTFPSFILVEDITGAIWPLGSPVTASLFASEAWTIYSPSLTQSVNVTKTDTYSRYMKLGRTVYFEFQLTVTGSGTGGNSVLVSLPFLPVGNNQIAGIGEIIDASAGLAYRGLAKVLTSGLVFFIPTETTVNNVLGVTSFTAGLAAGDVVSGSITYEAVS